MSKLTLSVDPAVAARAKEYARRHGTSVSRMVETYLSAISGPEKRAPDPPVLRALRGSLRRADMRDYRKHLETKYR